MNSSPDTKEKFSSQIPALKFLKALDYKYLTPSEAMEQRDESTANVLLYDILRDSLRTLPCNLIDIDGQTVQPPDDMLNEAIRYIDNHVHENIIADNRDFFRKLTLGESFRGTIDGKEVSKHIRYIDFDSPFSNVFHMTEEYSVLRTGIDKHYRPDVVAFVNGIPVVIMECKRRGRGQVERAVKDHLKKQDEDGIKRLYVYSQVLMAICGNKAMYGAIGAKINFWNRWKEDKNTEVETLEELKRIKQTQPDSEFKNAIFSWRDEGDQEEMEEQWDNVLEPTEQDKLIYNMLQKDRIIKDIGSYIVFEGDAKIIARHQQYYGIESALEKILHVDDSGVRKGGLFWHTTGSGKSITMVMLAKAILESNKFSDPRIVLVTDRVSLDQNIFDCFSDCNVEVTKIRRGRAEQTTQMINARNYKVLSTVIDRLETPLKKFKAKDVSNETFIFVDEAHRTHSETSHKRAVMKAIFPNASIIGFTGTPLKKGGNDTAELFGGWIHKYSMDAALDDKAVCRIVYSNKHCPLSGDDQSLERWFERRTRSASSDVRQKLKKTFKSQDEVLKASARREEIAYDISEHFKSNYRVEANKVGLKGMFATSSKYEALKYLESLEQNGISCNLVMSAPGESEGEVTVRANEKEEIERFWKEVVERKYGGEESYNLKVFEDFKKKHDPEIVVVVDKLLTGFNNPRSAVLYTDKTLREHKVLQAIARVNRPFPGKEYGEVVDYRNIIGEVTSAIEFYRKLEDEGYEAQEIEKVLFDVETEIQGLENDLNAIWSCFPENSDTFNRMDQTMMVRHLLTKETYSAFMLAFKKFHYKYKLAKGHFKWVRETDKETQEEFQKAYKYFVGIRAEAEDELGENDGLTYGELVDDIRRFVEDKISSDPPVVKLDQVDLFSKEYEERCKKKKSKRSQADSIRIRLKRFFEENWDEDPILAQTISDIINETYDRFKNQLDADVAYFEAMMDIRRRAEDGTIIRYPDGVKSSPELKAYFSLLKHHNVNLSDEHFETVAKKIKSIIGDLARRDWTRPGNSVTDKMEQALLKDVIWPLGEKYNITIDADTQNQLLLSIIGIAKNHQGR